MADDEAMRIASKDRCYQFRAAQAQARRVEAAAERAAPAEKAALWLNEYGRNCTGRDAGDVRWTSTFARTCSGVEEAGEYIVKAIYMLLPTIIAEAQDLAEADMVALINAFSAPLPEDVAALESSHNG